MTREDINDIINTICPNDVDYEKPCISPKYLRQELEQLALDQGQWNEQSTTKNDLEVDCVARQDVERYIEGFINEYTPKEELEFINLELDGLKHIPTVTPQEPRWISVNERVPEDGTLNLFTDGMTVSVERYKADALDHFYPDGRWFSLDEVIAWMPLPKPYEPMESEG